MPTSSDRVLYPQIHPTRPAASPCLGEDNRGHRVLRLELAAWLVHRLAVAVAVAVAEVEGVEAEVEDYPPAGLVRGSRCHLRHRKPSEQ